MEEDFRCPGCGKLVGKIGKVGKHTLLIMGNNAVAVLRSTCMDCGHDISWSISEYALAKLIQDMLDNMDKYK